METKRVLLATALSMAVLLVWTFFFSPKPAPQPAPPAQPAEQPAATGAGQAAQPGQPAASDLDLGGAAKAAVETGRQVTIETPLYTARVNAKGGTLASFVLKDYRQSTDVGAPQVQLLSDATSSLAPLGLIVDGQPSWAAGEWTSDAEDTKLAPGQTAELRLVGMVGGTRVVRKLTFSADNYLVKESVRLEGDAVPDRVAFTLASAALTPDDSRYNQTRVEYYSPEGHESETDVDDLRAGISYAGQVQWGGVQDNYFLLALAPGFEPGTFKGLFVDDLYRVAMEKTGLVPDASGGASLNMDYYLGPKDKDKLAGLGHELSEAIDYGFFSVIAKPLMTAINVFYGFTGNYGVAIILLTIIIKVLFIPLSYKSYKSMNEMKKLQPMMQKLKEKHGDDRQAFNQELMQLYKTYKVNPVGGCVPMLLQIPVFLGLYNALLASIELRHASFIATVPFTDIPWLADLSAHDPFYVTPVIMGATMFLQQRLTPAAGDPTQQKVMMFMPIMFTFFFLNFPAGLVVYWLVNNVLSIAQQWWMLRRS